MILSVDNSYYNDLSLYKYNYKTPSLRLNIEPDGLDIYSFNIIPILIILHVVYDITTDDLLYIDGSNVDMI